MRKFAFGVALALTGASAQSATVVILTDPLTMERQTIVIDRNGPDRVLMCMAPPANSGCTELPLKRQRSSRR